jgi:hypothetical protein
MSRFIKSFKTILYANARNHALITNTAVTVVLMTGADLLQQCVEHDNFFKLKTSEYDSTRTKHIAVVGLVTGPLMHGWYELLDGRYPGKAFKVIAKKLTLDQIIGSPLFIIVYFIGISLLEGKNIRESWHEFADKFPFVYLVS